MTTRSSSEHNTEHTANATRTPEGTSPELRPQFAFPDPTRPDLTRTSSNSPSTPPSSTSTREPRPDVDGQPDPRIANDAAKLRTIADWFDLKDDRDDYAGLREVQADLRRIARQLDGLTTPVVAAGLPGPLDQAEREAASREELEPIRRLDVAASLRYIGADGSQNDPPTPWVVELGVEDDGFNASLTSGWGEDPLAAALMAAENAYAAVLHLAGYSITGRDRNGHMSLTYQTREEAAR